MRRIADLITSDLGPSFTGEDARNWLRPCVYCFLKDDEPLYIGMSGTGIARSFTSGHKQAGEARDLCTKLSVWFCRSEQAAKELEALLIEKLQPRFNRNGVMKKIWERLGYRTPGAMKKSFRLQLALQGIGDAREETYDVCENL